MNKTGYFWFSEDMYNALLEDRDCHQTFCNVDGVEQEYTLWTDVPEHNSGWEDIQLLGFGEFVRSERLY